MSVVHLIMLAETWLASNTVCEYERKKTLAAWSDRVRLEGIPQSLARVITECLSRKEIQQCALLTHRHSV